ncbi:MAG: 5-methyltetrahydropteroyltriglutamate--homocysteine S-methyltransferase, partial [Deltaproteobacteria bacterium]|nr:5-methyltetrahydropteroyltriglutamate--homocysteine S-methyltransferase [Deltaproteobacteria bacterium]
MTLATNLGFPRLGAHRELKRALEQFWGGKIDQASLLETARALRERHWKLAKEAGLDHIPSNDFSFYDHVLDTACMVGAVPSRYPDEKGPVTLKTYFAMARGLQDKAAGLDVPAMEMTKWFDTNYHYIVPEFAADQAFRLASTKAVAEFEEAKALGVHTRPVLLGPVSFLLLGKMHGEAAGAQLRLLPALLPVYEEILSKLAAAGADWVQIDEPCLVLDLPKGADDAVKSAYARLGAVSNKLRILLGTYFGDLRDNLSLAFSLPVAAIHLDLVRGKGSLDQALKTLPEGMMLSLGLVNGRNIWRSDLEAAFKQLEAAIKALGSDRLMVGPSCSLLHVPVDLDLEEKLDDDLRSWLAFAKQKLAEIRALATAANEGRDAARAAFDASKKAVESRRTSKRIHNKDVEARLAKTDASMARRKSPYDERRKKQMALLGLPPYPTTTIGSFPQTKEVRAARAEFKAGKRDEASYNAFLREETEKAVRFQERIGIDVLVHGEFERNDMVEYFGEQLEGFAFTQHGWVQSYGSRGVKPPIIFGDVWRSAPMTVEWSKYAQSLTDRPMKGMLTGPVTILQWSFVRDDQPRSESCRQIALAIRDEVVDLESAGIKVVQIDEPALREGLPLRKSDWEAYLGWAVEAFKISSSGVKDETQIHTHMCYAEFNDIIESVGAMDADVISIETSRSQMELLDAFVRYRYPNEIGPGVYDIHSPRVPDKSEMEALLEKAIKVLKPEQIWVNPDCGLKTRAWAQV